MTSIFRKLILTGIAGILLIGVVGCTASSTSSGTIGSSAEATPESPASVIISPSADPATSPAAPASSTAPTIGAEPITTAQAEQAAGKPVSIYRGTVSDFAVNDAGQTIWILQQDIGVDYGTPMLHAAVTPEILMGSSGQSADIANGSHLEIFYAQINIPDGGQIPEAQAVAVNVMLPAEMTTFNGIIQEITPDPDKQGFGDLLLDPIDGNMQTVFHYSPETVFTDISLDTLKVGDSIHVIYNGISTRSIPPQSSAQIILPYTLCETACPEVPKPVVP